MSVKLNISDEAREPKGRAISNFNQGDVVRSTRAPRNIYIVDSVRGLFSLRDSHYFPPDKVSTEAVWIDAGREVEVIIRG